jgi:leucyl-tRNA synthetase
MSKSAGNGVDPLEVIRNYSADALRLWMSFIGDYFETATWSDDGVRACNKFLGRVENLKDILVEGNEYSKDLEVAIHTAIKKVSQDIDNIKFNTAISALMILLNEIGKVGKINHAEYKTLLTLLNPFAPHVTEELWTECGFAPKISEVKWPEWNEDKLVKDEIEYAIQINNKIVERANISASATNEEIESLVRSNEKVLSVLNGRQIVKIIVIKNRLVNIIAK